MELGPCHLLGGQEEAAVRSLKLTMRSVGSDNNPLPNSLSPAPKHDARNTRSYRELNRVPGTRGEVPSTPEACQGPPLHGGKEARPPDAVGLLVYSRKEPRPQGAGTRAPLKGK